MREVKFRAYIKHLKWVLPVCSIDFDYKTVEGDLSLGQGDTSEYEFSEIELMQYTGLEDKNEEQIYEGDIFHLGDKNIKYIVVWNDTGLQGKQLNSSSYVGLQHWKDRIEVIGNIYRN